MKNQSFRKTHRRRKNLHEIWLSLITKQLKLISFRNTATDWFSEVKNLFPHPFSTAWTNSNFFHRKNIHYAVSIEFQTAITTGLRSFITFPNYASAQRYSTKIFCTTDCSRHCPSFSTDKLAEYTVLPGPRDQNFQLARYWKLINGNMTVLYGDSAGNSAKWNCFNKIHVCYQIWRRNTLLAFIARRKPCKKFKITAIVSCSASKHPPEVFGWKSTSCDPKTTIVETNVSNLAPWSVLVRLNSHQRSIVSFAPFSGKNSSWNDF